MRLLLHELEVDDPFSLMTFIVYACERIRSGSRPIATGNGRVKSTKEKGAHMKSPGLNCLVGAMIVIASPACFAGPPVVTRSVDDMNADLMRTYQSPGGPSAGEIRSRSPDAAQADLVRDWNAKPATDPSVPIGSRNKTDAQNDLLRNWNAKPGTDD